MGNCQSNYDATVDKAAAKQHNTNNDATHKDGISASEAMHNINAQSGMFLLPPPRTIEDNGDDNDDTGSNIMRKRESHRQSHRPSGLQHRPSTNISNKRPSTIKGWGWGWGLGLGLGKRPSNIRRSNSIFFSAVKWRQRTVSGATFRRTSRMSEFGPSTIVMSTQSSLHQPWEGALAPGRYKLSSLVSFPDHEIPSPKFARIPVDSRNQWQTSTQLGKSGCLELSAEALATMVPVEMATSVLLEFYGCTLIDSNASTLIQLHTEHSIQDFYYAPNYYQRYSKKFGGLEQHDFAHIDCPLDSLDESGLFVLGKWSDSDDGDDSNNNALLLTAFRVPQMHALYIPAGVIHTNDYLCGTWRTMLSWTTEIPIDHVQLKVLKAMTSSAAKTKSSTTRRSTMMDSTIAENDKALTTEYAAQILAMDTIDVSSPLSQSSEELEVATAAAAILNIEPCQCGPDLSA